MKLLIRLVVTALLVLLIGHFLPGVHVVSFTTAIIVAIVLGLLNLFIKPILVILTLPVTVITLGLFLLVINAIIILLCTHIVGGFHVDTFLTALIFSVVLSVLQSIANAIIGED
ncbi:phage holin family protein [Flavobacterium sp. Fl-77]|uniref:Phage holin family protein n=1 Tax=Flavobacterium flavipigmentatum TaxID=2893884 RepID=A0AAJ2VZ03_9FLAO|nr:MULTISPECIES: phage holin family protein [unclassified Flavobacterium]MDX6183578.1 phage holin family protein [Flavobacterium sp. Fl-33]MDX6187020.1 phage holin family protein [Flavobacterium sp. Fl-77]UFH40248.1 phage holin family protein [Flavobacterium sp. F-70]